LPRTAASFRRTSPTEAAGAGGSGLRGLRPAPRPGACRPPLTEDVPIHLVQLLLPVYDNDGTPFPPATYAPPRDELTERFGGLTAYTRAPAQGLWADDDDGPPRRDDIIVWEVMAESIDRAWWTRFREALERRFAQEELVVRAQRMERL
jgi:hypothetical protein